MSTSSQRKVVDDKIILQRTGMGSFAGHAISCQPQDFQRWFCKCRCIFRDQRFNYYDHSFRIGSQKFRSNCDPVNLLYTHKVWPYKIQEKILYRDSHNMAFDGSDIYAKIR